VEEICDQAVKEEKMEDTLRRMGSTWEVRDREGAEGQTGAAWRQRGHRVDRGGKWDQRGNRGAIVAERCWGRHVGWGCVVLA